MVNNPEGAKKAIETQIKRYGSKEALSAEMRRRNSMRKTIGKGGFHDHEVARKAAARSIEVRRENAKNKAQAKDPTKSQD